MRAVPPAYLIEPCKEPAPRAFIVTRDIYDSREDWRLAFRLCASKFDRLVNWQPKDK